MLDAEKRAQLGRDNAHSWMNQESEDLLPKFRKDWINEYGNEHI